MFWHPKISGLATPVFVSHLINLSNQTHNAVMLSSKCEIFALQIHHT